MTVINSSKQIPHVKFKDPASNNALRQQQQQQGCDSEFCTLPVYNSELCYSSALCEVYSAVCKAIT